MFNFSKLTIEAVVANQSGTMEADTISKNGRSLKSQMSRENFLIIVCFALSAMGIIFSGCNNKIKKDDEIKKDAKEYSNEGYSKFCEIFENQCREEFGLEETDLSRSPIQLFLKDYNQK